MFYGCSSLKSVPLFCTSKVTAMVRLFDGCSSLKSVPLFDTSNVTDMERLFDGCSSLEDLDVHNFKDYDFSVLDNDYLKEKYPEVYV